MSTARKGAGWVIGVLLAGILLAAIAWHQQKTVQASDNYVNLTLLIPDGMAQDAPEVRIWKDAASERGVLLDAQHVSQWMRGVNYGGGAAHQAVIVPDTFHRSMSDVAVQTIYQVVQEGGKAMIVQDGGLLNEAGYYSDGPARFSKLVGVEYGDYHQWHEQLSYYDQIRGTAETMEKLGIPPGRYLTPDQAARLSAIDDDDIQRSNPRFPDFIAGYSRESQRFAVFKTNRPSLEQDLLESNQGEIVASMHRYGKGQALFVNMPLTYLVERTDGIFLHGFLHYFATTIVGQPELLSSPNGMGSLILNWHNDDGKAIHLLHELQDAGIFNHGHQSMHFTAGPDVNQPGDGLGMDLNHNTEAQEMIALLKRQGHMIGNHGGWIHNWFGIRADENDADDFEPFLDLNNEAVTRANGGEPPIEYSAPMGNQPLWVYDWLARQGVTAYYTDANVGMPPTHTWIGQRKMDMSWSFPVLTYGQVASAEEAGMNGVSIEEFQTWLDSIARFIEEQRTMRLSYFHPIGAVAYLPAVKHYIDTVQECANRNRCQFISMAEAAQFLSMREKVRWTLKPEKDSDVITATHPDSLDTMTWSVPKSRYAGVEIMGGEASVENGREAWLVRAGQGRELTVRMRRIS